MTISFEKRDFLQTAPNIGKLYIKLKLSKRRVDKYQFRVWSTTEEKEKATWSHGFYERPFPVTFPSYPLVARGWIGLPTMWGTSSWDECTERRPDVAQNGGRVPWRHDLPRALQLRYSGVLVVDCWSSGVSRPRRPISLTHASAGLACSNTQQRPFPVQREKRRREREEKEREGVLVCHVALPH